MKFTGGGGAFSDEAHILMEAAQIQIPQHLRYPQIIQQRLIHLLYLFKRAQAVEKLQVIL